jgi:pimeloyl-ACP methyl ester carboxylesterase
MSGSITDLDDCLSFLEGDARFASLSLSVIGHSWGGYAAALSPALHPNLSHVVVLSGAISLRAIVRTFLGGLLAPYRRAVAKLERETNPNTADLNAAEVLKKTQAKVLCIYSENDHLIRAKLHYKPLAKALSGKAGAKLILEKNKGHNPNYTEAAVTALSAYLKEKALFRREHPHPSEEEKAAFRARFDWDAMTEQDAGVWHEILAWLDN